MIQKMAEYIKNIVQKNAGRLGQGLLTIVLIVIRKLLLVSQLIKSIATKIVGTSIIGKDSKDTTPLNGRAVKPRKINLLEHHQHLESGVKKFINETIILARSAVGEVRKGIGLSCTHIILNHYQNTPNLPLKSIMEKHCVLSVIGIQTAGAITNDPKYIDVIRKRYAKFIGKEDEWESLTQ